MTFLLGLPSWLPSASIFLTTSMPSMTLPNTCLQIPGPYIECNDLPSALKDADCRTVLDGSVLAVCCSACSIEKRKQRTTWRPSSQLVMTVVMKN